MVRQLRAHLNSSHNSQHGLILANGGVLTHENAICLSTHSRLGSTPYPVDNPDAMDLPSTDGVVVLPTGSGKATIEVISSSILQADTFSSIS